MNSDTIKTGLPHDWAKTLVEPASFDREQKRLAYVWTFLGLKTDLAKDGDWFRAILATRSVFVQRFGTELKGFENVCAHRFYPLRHMEKGNGPILCGHHQWLYDRHGCAIGIPLCKELYGVTPRELEARLNPVEIATCGTLVFGRFPPPDGAETLKSFLGKGYPILEAMSQMDKAPQFLSQAIQANWKLCLHISLDDYHIVAIHPTTFGKAGHVHREDIGYYRFGFHSAFFTIKKAEALEEMAANCRAGVFRPDGYRIFQILPNLIMVHFRADARFWYCLIQQIVPISHDQTLSRSWLYPAPFPADHHWHVRWTRSLTDPIRKRIVSHYVRRVFREDNEVCERVQSIAHQIDKSPLLGALEERIIWFDESYRRLLSGEPTDASADELP